MENKSPPATNPKFEELFRKLISQVEGLQAILVSTCEGVPLIKVIGEDNPGVEPQMIAHAETKFSYIFAVAASQAANLRLGNLNSITR